MKEILNLPAQFNERVGAFSLDIAPLVFGYIVLSFMPFNIILKVFIMIIIFLLLDFIPSFSKNGVTFGKMIKKLKVVDESNNEISIKMQIIRELVKAVLIFVSAGLYVLICLYLFSKRIDRKLPHDLLMKTKVVYSYSKIVG